MKKNIILTFLILITLKTFALDFESNYKLFSKDADSLFMSAVNVLSSNSKYQISEIQTKNGYILFNINSKYYLLTLTKRYQNQTEIKIFPQNSDFTGDNNTASEIFSLIEQDLKTNSMELVK